MRQKLSHLSSFPHFKLPHDLLFHWILGLSVLTTCLTGRAKGWSISLACSFLLLSCCQAHVFQVKDHPQKTLHISSLLQFQVFVTNDDHGRNSALLFTLLKHLQRDLNLTDFSLAIMMDQSYVNIIRAHNLAKLCLICEEFVRGETPSELGLCGTLSDGAWLLWFKLVELTAELHWELYKCISSHFKILGLTDIYGQLELVSCVGWHVLTILLETVLWVVWHLFIFTLNNLCLRWMRWLTTYLISCLCKFKFIYLFSALVSY